MASRFEDGAYDAIYDAIIVGSGIGGLVCAAYLAVAGRRVLLLEHHDVVGGNTQVFRRRRSYEFDVGVHYLGDCGPDGIIPAVLAGLGAAGRVAFRPIDQDGFDQVRLPGLAVDVPADWDRYLLRLQEALPGESAQVAACVRVLRTVAQAVRGYLVGTSGTASGASGGAPAATMEQIRQGSRSLGELFADCGLSPRAATLLAAQSGNYGSPPSTTPTSTHAAMLDHYLRGAYYPEGGGQMLAATLTEVIEGHGGTVRTRCAVEQILISDDQRVEGVVLADGDVVRAPIVVSNADYRHTVLRLCRGRGFPPSVVAKTRAATARAAVAIAYVALDRPLDLPNANLWCWAQDDIEQAYAQACSPGAAGAAGASQPPFVFLSFASLKDPQSRTVCPPGHSNFQIMTLVPPSNPRSSEDSATSYRRGADYLANKNHLATALVAAAERAIGPFRAHITHLETATALTNQRYTLSSSGSPYGLDSWGGAGRRPDVRTGISGLYLVGQSTRFGAGVAGTAISGITVAGLILDRALLPEVHAGAVLGDSSVLPERSADFDPLQVSRGQARRTARGLARIA